MTHGHSFDSCLISLAKRFNTAYYLLLNTGDLISGGETRGWLTFVGCGGNAPNCRTPEVPAAETHCPGVRSLFLFGSNSSLLVRRNQKNSTGYFEGGFGSNRSNPRIWRIILRDW